MPACATRQVASRHPRFVSMRKPGTACDAPVTPPVTPLVTPLVTPGAWTAQNPNRESGALDVIELEDFARLYGESVGFFLPMQKEEK